MDTPRAWPIRLWRTWSPRLLRGVRATCVAIPLIAAVITITQFAITLSE